MGKKHDFAKTKTPKDLIPYHKIGAAIKRCIHMAKLVGNWFFQIIPGNIWNTKVICFLAQFVEISSPSIFPSDYTPLNITNSRVSSVIVSGLGPDTIASGNSTRPHSENNQTAITSAIEYELYIYS